MLKLTYTENSFYLELLTQSVEEWIQARVILTLRVGQSLCVEPSTASFLLPVDLPGLGQL
ncbi:MAG: alr0857 family protein, partial [Cyanobacteria bacterium P01_D01_bin.50]